MRIVKEECKIKVLSLFDGIGSGYLALRRAGINIEEYYASEVDRYAIAIAKYNIPNIKHVGDIRNLDPGEFDDIDIIIGGSPCQDFSVAGRRNGITVNDIELMDLETYLRYKSEGVNFDGQGYLFWEYVRLLNAIKPKYFLFENVRMIKRWREVASRELGVEPIILNSSLVSAQNRVRLYWTNIPVLGFPNNIDTKLIDIIEHDIDEKYYYENHSR